LRIFCEKKFREIGGDSNKSATHDWFSAIVRNKNCNILLRRLQQYSAEFLRVGIHLAQVIVAFGLHFHINVQFGYYS
jgi:hypothetical protein